ncbi:ring-hydroxylating dioxygenase subunit beta [Rhodovarius crocodyli]|uniref:Ring-hydroxylating dioxygenase subunit beta n=1 Tax=Rhodovarius crocodyli TaxID=1979269 RepID=A0A437MHI7_9PROT|nr:nuclear transport factor 2 family protein [Rhodovarius crocodyli]RVT97091.1 ring-hydroxylating dioxygenase subunit beta [Rhodovarius crocodyli]
MPDSIMMDPRLSALLLRAEVDAFNTDYCATLDAQKLMEWVEFFTEDGFYSVISRENFDSNLPVGLIHCEGKAMVKDRAFALLKTAMFGPRYLRHMVSNLAVDPPRPDGSFAARANYIVFEVLTDRPDARILQVGSFLDEFRRVDGTLKLASRRCIYDTLLVPTALCIPV